MVIVDNSIVSYYYIFVIVTFKDKETENIWHGKVSEKFQKDIQRIMRRKLIVLHGSISLQDLRLPPDNRLHALEGNRKGQHSIRINSQWRICFKWENGNAYDVEIVDCHS